MSRKRRNLLSKKRKNSKRNTKRSTKTRKNIRKMRGGGDGITVGGIGLKVGSTFAVEQGNKITVENTRIFNDTLQQNVFNYKVESINGENDPLITVNPLDREGDHIDAHGQILNEEDLNLNQFPQINILKSVLDNRDIFKLVIDDFEPRRPE